jgi:uncharacterized membrane protein YkvA (DUF1232 family)
MWGKSKKSSPFTRAAEGWKAAGKDVPFGEYFQIGRRYLKAYGNGKYRRTPWRSILLGIIAILYFLIPIDIIPDFFFLLGWVDDVVFLSFFLSSLKKDLDRFLEWEAANRTIDVTASS